MKNVTIPYKLTLMLAWSRQWEYCIHSLIEKAERTFSFFISNGKCLGAAGFFYPAALFFESLLPDKTADGSAMPSHAIERLIYRPASIVHKEHSAAKNVILRKGSRLKFTSPAEK